MTLMQALDEYKSVFMPARNFSPRTRVEYSYDVEELIIFLEKRGVKKVGELGIPQLDRYLAELDNKQIAGTTRKRKVVSIRSFLTFLYQNDYLAVNLAKRLIPPKPDFKSPKFLMETEYKRLLNACSYNLRDYAIVQLILQTGIKLSELTHLTLDDVELSDKEGAVRVKGQRGKDERIIPLNSKACDALKTYLADRTDANSSILFLNRFEEPLKNRGVQKMLGKYLKKLELERVSVHTLRHTFGIYHAAKGTSTKTLKDVMGHKDKRSTDIYINLAKDICKKELQDNSL